MGYIWVAPLPSSSSVTRQASPVPPGSPAKEPDSAAAAAAAAAWLQVGLDGVWNGFRMDF